MLEPPLLYFWIIPLIIWSAVWKLIALWKAARNRQLVWFICLAIFNTAGVPFPFSISITIKGINL
ncbi:MAG: hypothetical protein Ct9H90mP13_01340 [Pseudomonadota bacterium]|nr:MAG: hypothetical protein Ct9H90mP13_01340 [Pseudomonadota bacterium]